MIKRLFFHIRTKKHGQSFVELMLIILILALMLSGVVEFGYLLNSYLKVLDGAREGARFSNAGDAFAREVLPPFDYIYDGDGLHISNQNFYIFTTIETLRVMSPITLNGNLGDDIVISVFSVAGGSILRWPAGYVDGWNLCDHSGDAAFVGDLIAANWSSCTARPSHFTTAQVLARMDASAPPSGVLLVEVYYNYPQILKLPVFAQVIPDPMPVYTYSMMPLLSAEPTPTPIP